MRQSLLIAFLLVALSAFSGSIFRPAPNTANLSSRFITCICQDKFGYMWFGTKYGINRYDGFHVRQYLMDDINSKHINKVVADRNNNLWVELGFQYRVMVYDRDKDLFYGAEKFCSDRGLNINSVHKAFCDNSKHIWLTSNDSIIYYDCSKDRLTPYPYKHSRDIYSLAVVNSTIYISRMGHLQAMDISTGNIKDIPVDDEHLASAISSNKTLNFVTDDNSNLWIYTYESSYVWCREMYSTSFKRLSISSDNIAITGLIDDHDGNIWISTNRDGLYIIDKITGKISNIHQYSTDQMKSLSYVSALYTSGDGVIWSGIFPYGVYFMSRPTVDISTHRFDKYVNILYVDNYGQLWIGSNGMGIEIADSEGNRRDPGFPMHTITAMLQVQNGDFWIGTFAEGLYHCDAKGVIAHYTAENSGIPEDNIYAVSQDKDGNLWLGTLFHGLIKYDGKNFIRDFPAISSVTNTVYDSVTNTLYISSDVGLGIYNLSSGKQELIEANRAGDVLLPSRHVENVLLDSHRRLWIIVKGGIMVWDPKTDDAILITQDDGIPGNLISAIVEDKNGNVWITTDNGAAKINYNGTKPNVSTYTMSDGLICDWFHGPKSAALLPSGEILLGGDGGYNVIRSTDIKYDRTQHPFLVTGVFYQNRPLDRCFYLLKDGINTITIPGSMYPTSHDVRITFSDFDYSYQNHQQLYYKVNNVGEWMKITDNQISLTHISAGHYEFKIRKMDENGFLVDDYAVIRLDVEPPFWLSIWAKIIYLVIFVGIAYLILRNYFKKKKDKLCQEAEKKEIDNKIEMDELKMRFFTNISHDLRTPLSLIISPLEELRKRKSDALTSKNIDVAYRNANHLLSLVNQLLEFRKLDVKAESMHLSQGDFIAFVKDQFDVFKEYADNNQRNISLQSGESELVMQFDKDKMQRVMYNLLSNAFKYTDKNGNINVSVKREDEKVYVSIEDDGIGISDENKSKVFDRFYQVADSDEVHTGSGVGLHIVKEYIALHHGEIKVEDRFPKGTIFTFYIPAINESQKDTLTDKEYTSYEGVEDMSSDKPTILVVEDNCDFRNFIADSLDKHYNVIRVEDGAEALKMLDKHNIDIVVTDVMMPNVSGTELCKRMKRNLKWSHIPVIMMTARSADTHKIQGLECGADDYITKPFSLNLMKLRIERFWEWRKRSISIFKEKIDVKPSDITINKVDEVFVEKAIKLVEANLDNSEFSVEEFAAELSLSRTSLYRKIRSLTGKTPLEFILHIRLGHAKKMLEAGMSVSEVAYKIGYNQPKYFSKQFHDEFDETPSEYKKRMSMKQ